MCLFFGTINSYHTMLTHFSHVHDKTFKLVLEEKAPAKHRDLNFNIELYLRHKATMSSPNCSKCTSAMCNRPTSMIYSRQKPGIWLNYTFNWISGGNQTSIGIAQHYNIMLTLFAQINNKNRLKKKTTDKMLGCSMGQNSQCS